MPVGGRRLRNRDRVVRFQESRQNLEEPTPQREPTRNILLKLVDSVVAYHSRSSVVPCVRVFEITRARNDDPEINIMAKIHGVNDGWAGVINNENSLMTTYHLIPREKVTFFFAAKLPRGSGVTQVPLNPNLVQLFNPVSTTNAIPPDSQPLRNAYSWVHDWSGVISGTTDSYEALVQVFRMMPTSVVSFIIAGNR